MGAEQGEPEGEVGGPGAGSRQWQWQASQCVEEGAPTSLPTNPSVGVMRANYSLGACKLADHLCLYGSLLQLQPPTAAWW